MFKYGIVAIVLGLTMIPLTALGESKDSPDVSTLKTFGTSGKQLYVHKDGKEAELFKKEGARCLRG